MSEARPIDPAIDPGVLLRHGPGLRALVRTLVRDAARADDVLQETWRAALERPPQRGGDVGGWLAVVARNFALRSRRTDARVARRETAAARPETVSHDVDASERAEELRRLSDAVARLREPLRTVIVERWYEDLSERAIAKAHGVSRWQVQTWLREAHEELRRALDRGRRGNRAAWIVALAPIAGRPEGTFGLGTTGGFVMGTKVGALAVGVVLGFGAGWIGRELAAPRAADDSATAPNPGTAPTEPPRAPRPAPPRAEAPREDRSSTPPSAPASATPQTLDAEAFLRRINETPEWKEAWGITQEMAAVPGDAGADAFIAIYARIADADRRAQGIKSFFMKTVHPRALDVIDLGVHDADPKPRQFAISYLKQTAFRDFGADASGYAAWRAQTKGRPPLDVFTESFIQQVSALGTLRGGELTVALEAFDSQFPLLFDKWKVDGRQLAERAGLAAVVSGWLRDPETPSAARTKALEWLPFVPGSDAIVREIVLPAALDGDRDRQQQQREARQALGRLRPAWAVDAVGDVVLDANAPAERRRAAIRTLAELAPERAALERFAVPVVRDAASDAEVWGAACEMLGEHGKPWALPILLDAIVQAPKRRMWWSAARGIGALGDPAAIPTLIAVIEADGATYDSAYGVGYFGLGFGELGNLTGVRYDKSHDGAWWRAWWEKNRGRFGDAGNAAIPALRPRACDLDPPR